MASSDDEMRTPYKDENEKTRDGASRSREQTRIIVTLKNEIKKAPATYNREVERATKRFNEAKLLANEKAKEEEDLYPGKINLRGIDYRKSVAVKAALAEYNKEKSRAKENEIKRIKELKLRLKDFGIFGGSKVRKSISKKTKKSKRRKTKREKTKKKKSRRRKLNKRKYSKR
jgi:hypothetical protein